jgi:hypothetical protein
MKETPVGSTPVPEVDPDLSDPFAWPRKPTLPLVQQPFDFEALEYEGDNRAIRPRRCSPCIPAFRLDRLGGLPA